MKQGDHVIFTGEIPGLPTGSVGTIQGEIDSNKWPIMFDGVGIRHITEKMLTPYKRKLNFVLKANTPADAIQGIIGFLQHNVMREQDGKRRVHTQRDIMVAEGRINVLLTTLSTLRDIEIIGSEKEG